MTRTQTSARDRVLQTAAALFAERGFHGTSVRDIADACGMRPSSLYNHVSDKNDMLLHIVGRYLDALDRVLPDEAGGPGDGGTRLAAMIRASLGVAGMYPDEFLTLSNSWTYIRRTPELTAVVARRDAGRALWADVLAAGIADGSLRGGLDPGEVLRVVFSALHGSLDRRFDAPDASAAPSAEAGTDTASAASPSGAETLVTLLLDGLRPRG
ncbi:TetR/AcrR family transcriptional regulator [Streptodolium elevatio]|uniref:TetR/AcrR family transcriptional regulator n=1 Tax=Streptodolium elevatio TaxID=3157996 RepID=A0ABV3DIV4_9ACTN